MKSLRVLVVELLIMDLYRHVSSLNLKRYQASESNVSTSESLQSKKLSLLKRCFKMMCAACFVRLGKCLLGDASNSMYFRGKSIKRLLSVALVVSSLA